MILERLNLEDECCDAKRQTSGQGKGGSRHRECPTQLPVLENTNQFSRLIIPGNTKR